MKLLMVLAMAIKIVFPANDHRSKELVFYHAESYQFKKSWEMLTDAGHVVLPRNIASFGVKASLGGSKADMWKDLIRKDDVIEIYSGYNSVPDDLPLRFRGYVSGISLEAPIIIRFEDAMRKLKKHHTTFAKKNTSVKEIVTGIIPEGIDTHITDIKIHKVSMSKRTAAQVLQALKDDLGIYSYYQREKLVVGEIYFDNDEIVEFDFNNNVKESGLEWVDREEFPTQVTVKYMELKERNGKREMVRKEVSEGLEGGNTIKVWAMEATNEKEARAIALKKLELYNKSGFDGTVTTFGHKVLDHGIRARLTNTEFPEREGEYWVKSVEERWSSSTKHQVIAELDYQAA